MCQLVCPEGCVHPLSNEKKYDPDLDFCKGCGLCAIECPVAAISMIKEEK